MFGKIDNLSHRYLLEVRGTFVAMKLGWRVCLDSYRVKEDYITGMFALSLNIILMPQNKSPSFSSISTTRESVVNDRSDKRERRVIEITARLNVQCSVRHFRFDVVF